MRLETPRLLLRPWAPEDVEALVDGLGDFEVARWLARVPHPYTPEDAAGWIGYCAGLAPISEGGRTCEWAIELRGEGRVIGGTSLERIDLSNGTAGGGIWIDSRCVGQGYGREAFGERIRFAFEELGLRRLENGFFAGNDASLRMQERLGYRIEGTKRQALRCLADSKLKDEVITGLLREDWTPR